MANPRRSSSTTGDWCDQDLRQLMFHAEGMAEATYKLARQQITAAKSGGCSQQAGPVLETPLADNKPATSKVEALGPRREGEPQWWGNPGCSMQETLHSKDTCWCPEGDPQQVLSLATAVVAVVVVVMIQKARELATSSSKL